MQERRAGVLGENARGPRPRPPSTDGLILRKPLHVSQFYL